MCQRLCRAGYGLHWGMPPLRILADGFFSFWLPNNWRHLLGLSTIPARPADSPGSIPSAAYATYAAAGRYSPGPCFSGARTPTVHTPARYSPRPCFSDARTSAAHTAAHTAASATVSFTAVTIFAACVRGVARISCSLSDTLGD